ncbi:GNAT family N-acetyltransferase [Acidisphaera sp. L21]|uniref:GNAT family N-acetyltransferase n=1 Tax=Acidisphaera sp. L21 TaxID=1641851 RepID=UPI001C20A987|nr:GNAT family N-acetyltransferase [Acidisphaera sp. L21]
MSTLVLPSRDRLPVYVDALQRAWSPSTTRDVCAERLAAIAEDADVFIQQQITPSGTMALDTGEVAALLPGTSRWIWDESDGFCGSINLRYQRGTTDLPPYVSGHIGYSVVPWRQRHGHGTAALRLMLPIAAEHGLPHVIITCDTDNEGSRKVIEANGGVYLQEDDDASHPGTRKRVYEVRIA